MKITVLTLFPNFFSSSLEASILGRAVKSESVEYSIVNIRDFAVDKHQTTDDRPYGGGPGMVMKVDVIFAALKSVLKEDPAEHRLRNLELLQKEESPQTWVILTSAKGKSFTQATAHQYSKIKHLIIICGHYEGVDERVAEHLVDEEVRIGNYVLTGGEPAASVMIDAVTRLLPGVLGNDVSNQDESHSTPGQLGFGQYTRPAEFNGWQVPEVLINGHHGQITQWRQDRKSHDSEPHE